MIKIEFNYNQQIIEIQSNTNEIFQEAINKYLQKSLLEPESVIFYINDQPINPEKTIESQMNSLNKNNNSIKVLVLKIDSPKQIFIKSKDIICPICQGLCRIKYDDLSITLYDCEKNHTTNLPIMKFDEMQKINISNIICNQCKLNNKGETYNHDFYICLTCKQNICPLCKSKHENNHNIIKYEEKNYICSKHNDIFFKYCQDCKMNICILCENEHKRHKMIFFGDLISKIEEIKNKLKEKKKEIELFKENINKVIIELDNFMKIIDKYIDINKEMLDNYDIKKKNYIILSNISEINDNNDIFNKLRAINDMGCKILNTMKINEKEREIEEELKLRLQEIETEKNKREIDILKNKLIQKDKEIETIINNNNIEKDLSLILKKISKLNTVIKKLKRNINIDAILFNNGKIISGKDHLNQEEIMIKVENYEEGIIYYWNQKTFYKRYNLIKELFQKFIEGNGPTIIKKEDDPLWDENKPCLLGYAYYLLEPLCYLMSNASSISIVSPLGDTVGELDVDIIPHDENDNEYEEVPESPFELAGQSLDFKVCIYGVKNLPKKFCKNLKIEYESFYDKKIYSTKIYNENDNNLTEFKIGEIFEHKIDYLTKEDIEYCEKEKLCFKVYAIEEVEKKGKQDIDMNELKMNADTLNEILS